MNCLCLLLFWAATAHSANILIAYETARRSHQIWIGELAQVLAQKGHNVTMGGSFARAIAESDNYHPVTFEGIFLTHYKINKTEHLSSSFWQKIQLNHQYNYAICNRTYHSKGFQNLWNYPENVTFDLLLLDVTFGPCLYPLIQKFHHPDTIAFTPSSLTPFLAEMMGLTGYPFVSRILEIEESESSFLVRLKNFVLTSLEIWFKSTMEVWRLENLATKVLNGTFQFRKLEKSISLLYVNEYPLLNQPKPLTPNIIPVGGLHIRKMEPLPGILQGIIDNANQGIVFFSSGTDVQQNVFSKETKLNFARAFLKLVQKTVIWKDNIDDEDHPFHDQPSNILIHKWVPQNEVLGHVHCKLIITTGGSLTIQEAIYHGVPVLGIPIYDEHHRNVKFIVDHHLGLQLDYHNLTEENILNAMNTILKNPIYLQNMEEFSRKFRDQPQNPLQKALYWVEHILRHNATGGASFLNPPARNQSFIIAHSVDILLFLTVNFLLAVSVTLTALYKLTVKLSKKQENKKIKKKQK